jgi:hypothetical protein
MKQVRLRRMDQPDIARELSRCLDKGLNTNQLRFPHPGKKAARV